MCVYLFACIRSATTPPRGILIVKVGHRHRLVGRAVRQAVRTCALSPDYIMIARGERLLTTNTLELATSLYNNYLRATIRLHALRKTIVPYCTGTLTDVIEP